MTRATLTAGLHTQMHQHVSAAHVTKDTQSGAQNAKVGKNEAERGEKGGILPRVSSGIDERRDSPLQRPCRWTPRRQLQAKRRTHSHGSDVQSAGTRAATPTRTEKNARCKVMAAGCRAGNPPTFIVLFEMAPANRQLSDGDARPWRHVLRDLKGPTGETLAHKTKNTMLKTESALTNRLQTSAMTHDTNEDGWRKAPRRADGRFGLNASTV